MCSFVCFGLFVFCFAVRVCVCVCVCLIVVFCVFVFSRGVLVFVWLPGTLFVVVSSTSNM